MEQTVQCPDKGQTLGKEKLTRWEKAGMTKAQWKEAVKFDSTDWGWVIMSIGMAIGAGIVFLPVQVGLAGIWIYLLSSIIGYPAMYLFSDYSLILWQNLKDVKIILVSLATTWARTGACS